MVNFEKISIPSKDQVVEMIINQPELYSIVVGIVCGLALDGVSAAITTSLVSGAIPLGASFRSDSENILSRENLPRVATSIIVGLIAAFPTEAMAAAEGTVNIIANVVEGLVDAFNQVDLNVEQSDVQRPRSLNVRNILLGTAAVTTVVGAGWLARSKGDDAMKGAEELYLSAKEKLTGAKERARQISGRAAASVTTFFDDLNDKRIGFKNWRGEKKAELKQYGQEQYGKVVRKSKGVVDGILKTPSILLTSLDFTLSSKPSEFRRAVFLIIKRMVPFVGDDSSEKIVALVNQVLDDTDRLTTNTRGLLNK